MYDEMSACWKPRFSADTSRASDVRRIAVVRPNHRLGNTLLLTPLVRELEACFPKAEIELVAAGIAAREVFRQFSQVTAVHSFPAASYRNPGQVLRLLHTLSRKRYDIAIDPILQSRSGRFLLGLMRARDRVGYRWGVAGRDRMLTHCVDPAGAPAHCGLSPVHLLRSAYFPRGYRDASPMSMPMPDLRLTESERRDGERQLMAVLGAAAEGRTRVGIFAHATGEKCYPAEWWRRIVAYFRKQPSVQLVEFVPIDGRPRLDGDIPALHTCDLRLLGAALAATSLVVIADGGVMHLADAAGARVLGLFKTTEPARYAPQRSQSEWLLARDANADAVAARIGAVLSPNVRTRFADQTQQSVLAIPG
jgi:ADP-heptose:LPS heptosyltransferase